MQLSLFSQHWREHLRAAWPTSRARNRNGMFAFPGGRSPGALQEPSVSAVCSSRGTSSLLPVRVFRPVDRDFPGVMFHNAG